MSVLLESNPQNALWFAFGSFFIASFAAILMGTDYRRLNLDHSKVAAADPAGVSTTSLLS